MHVELRVYNEGAAIRYFFPENVKGTLLPCSGGKYQFYFACRNKSLACIMAQAPYSLLPLNNWPDESERP
jgi:alpha-glucosidase